jgi:peptidoglycan hydrolase CwlO-like protein
MAEHKGWFGDLNQVLRQAEKSHQTRPDDANVVDIPQGLERLRKAIVAIQNEIVEAQAERGDIEQAWKVCQDEIAVAFNKNTARQKDAAHRLKRLQSEWVNITQDLGIRAELVSAPLDESTPDEAPDAS